MVELLAPAGSMEALKAAIAGGANAIYVGGNRFNARAYATNFDIEELTTAVKLCHLHNVRLFVTVNTLYKESEIQDLYEYLKQLYEIQVDALIVQDIGIMRFVQDHFKNFEIHASTQCSIHNVDGVNFFKQLGLKRVVVARENSLDEIKEMVKTGVEIEAFVHGALCVSYSGQCFMSQMIGKRSANRGMCAQPCRLPYELYKNNQKIMNQAYLMSTKDLCTIEQIPELINAGVASFKIEGRMKRPEYVYAITKAYRNAIDHSHNYDINKLKQLFNRDFTKGYLFNETQIISPIFSGNRGINVGKVIDFDRKYKKLKIKTFTQIHQGDGIRIGYGDEGKILNKIYQKGKLVNQVEANSILEIDYDHYIEKNTDIYRTTDFILEKDIDKEMSAFYYKHPISMVLSGKVGEVATLHITDGINNVSISSTEFLEEAKKPLDIQRITQQLSKLGNTIYMLENVKIDIDLNAFISITQINELRRNACEKLDELRSNKKIRESQETKPISSSKTISKSLIKNYIHVHTIEQLHAVLPVQDNEMIFMDASKDFGKAKDIYPGLHLVIPTISNDKSFDFCDSLLKMYPNTLVAVNNIGAYCRYQDKVAILLPGMNLSHSRSHQQFPEPTVLSLDMDYQDEKEIINIQKDLVLMTYGHIDNMLTKHCIISYQKFGCKKENCQQCKSGEFYLSDRMNARFPLLCDDSCIVHLLSEKPINRQSYSHQYLRFTIENETKTKEILRKYRY